MKDICTLPAEKRVPVGPNTLGQPVTNTSFIMNYLGTLVRNNAIIPFRAKSWKKVDKSYKDHLLSLIKKKFAYKPNPKMDAYILKSAGKKLREHRCDMKRDFYLKNKQPNEIPDYDWKIWVERWNSEEMKTKSQKAKESAESQITHHRNGSKSFARERHDYVEQHGVEPGPLNFFSITHTKKDKTFDLVTEDIISTVNARVNEIVGDSTNTEQVYAAEEAVLNEALGKERPGRVRGYGLGVTRSMLNTNMTSSSTQSNAQVMRMSAELDVCKQFIRRLWKEVHPNEPEIDIEQMVPPFDRQVPDASSRPSCNSSEESNPANNEN